MKDFLNFLIILQLIYVCKRKFYKLWHEAEVSSNTDYMIWGQLLNLC